MVAAKHTKFFSLPFKMFIALRQFFWGEWEFGDTSVKYFSFLLSCFLSFFLSFSFFLCTMMGRYRMEGRYWVFYGGMREVSFWQFCGGFFILFLFYFFWREISVLLASILLYYTTPSRICSPCLLVIVSLSSFVYLTALYFTSLCANSS